MSDSLKHAHYIVAFSGGADSVLAADWANRSHAGMTLWYLNHYAKHIEAARAQVFNDVRRRYPKANFIVDQADITRLAKRLRYSWEHTASLVRRKKLLRLKNTLPDAIVVTGHNYSDYLETVALRRLRKIPEASMPQPSFRDADTTFIRPLFKQTRAEIRAAVKQLGFAFFEDPANNDLQFARNRVRITTPVTAPQENQDGNDLHLLERCAKATVREISLPFEVWNQCTQIERARLLFAAFRRLAIVRHFTRSHFSRAHALPFALPPFFAHEEIESGTHAVVFRRGLGQSAALPRPLTPCSLRGNAITRRYTFAQSYGRKAVTKIFSERKLSPRQKRRTCIWLKADREFECERIIFSDQSEIRAAPGQAL